ncbi:hypothetical protein ACRQFN_09305 [Actinotignum sp. GS-2025e]|uniref:hypothetical protein n=1 Tax=unclassified Actinotignum TaxID=2632702 RepID=UPI003F4736DB
MDKYTISFNINKHQWLTSNGRYHYMDKARRTKQLRRRAFYEARAKNYHAHLDKPVFTEPVEVVAAIGYPTAGKADPPNAAPTVKALLDGLTDAELWPDDDSKHVARTSYERGPDTRMAGIHRVTLTITRKETN